MSNRLFKKESRLLYFIQILIDIFLVNFGFYSAFVFRFGDNISSRNIKPFFEIIPLISLITILFFHIYGVFKNDEKSYVEIAYSTLLSLIFISIGTMALTFFNRGFAFPRSIFLIALIIQFLYMRKLHNYFL